jgi:hypothetical protein
VLSLWGTRGGGYWRPSPPAPTPALLACFIRLSLAKTKNARTKQGTGRPLLGRLRHFFGDTEDRGRRASHFVLFFTPSQSHTLSREARRSGSRTSRSSPAADLPEAEEEAQERENNGTSGVHGGGYFAPHDTNNMFWTLLARGVLPIF